MNTRRRIAAGIIISALLVTAWLVIDPMHRNTTPGPAASPPSSSRSAIPHGLLAASCWLYGCNGPVPDEAEFPLKPADITPVAALCNAGVRCKGTTKWEVAATLECTFEGAPPLMISLSNRDEVHVGDHYFKVDPAALRNVLAELCAKQRERPLK